MPAGPVEPRLVPGDRQLGPVWAPLSARWATLGARWPQGGRLGGSGRGGAPHESMRENSERLRRRVWGCGISVVKES